VRGRSSLRDCLGNKNSKWALGPFVRQFDFHGVQPVAEYAYQLGPSSIAWAQYNSRNATTWLRLALGFQLRNGTFVPEFKFLPTRGIAMQEAIDRVMQAYMMMIANPTPEQAQATRERLATHLAGMDADEKTLAVEGLLYLRGPGRVVWRRMSREAT